MPKIARQSDATPRAPEGYVIGSSEGERAPFPSLPTSPDQMEDFIETFTRQAREAKIPDLDKVLEKV
jgi:hypothetical protein